MKQKCTNNKCGFSLIEVMVAMLLLAVVVVGAATVMYQTGGVVQRQQNKREAIVATNTLLEKFWNMSYADLQGLDGSTEGGSVVLNGNAMNYEISVDSQIDSNGGDCMEIIVDIDHMGPQDDVVITSRRYEYGLSKATVVP